MGLADIKALNLLQLAPGGHLGRFCVWTQGAFEKLDEVYGTMTKPSATRKHNGTPAADADEELGPLAPDQLRRGAVGGERAQAGPEAARPEVQSAQEPRRWRRSTRLRRRRRSATPRRR